MKKNEELLSQLVILQKDFLESKTVGERDINKYMAPLYSVGFTAAEAKLFLKGKLTEEELISIIKKPCPRDVTFFEMWLYDCISTDVLNNQWSKERFFVSQLDDLWLRDNLDWFRVFLSRSLGKPIGGCSSERYLNLAFDLYGLNPVGVLKGCQIKNEYNMYRNLYVFENVIKNLKQCNKLFALDFVLGNISEKYKLVSSMYINDIYRANECLDSIENGEQYLSKDYNHLLRMLEGFKVNLVLSNYRSLMGKDLRLPSVVCTRMGTYVGKFFKDFFEDQTLSNLKTVCTCLNKYYPEMYVSINKLCVGLKKSVKPVSYLYELKGKDKRCEYLCGVKIDSLLKPMYANPLKDVLAITGYKRLIAFKNIFNTYEDFVEFISDIKNFGGKAISAVTTLVDKRNTDALTGYVYPERIDYSMFVSQRASVELKKKYVLSYKDLVEYVTGFDVRSDFEDSFDGKLEREDLNMICYAVNKLDWVE